MAIARHNYRLISQYTVGIAVGGVLFLYYYTCSNHDEALRLASADHLKAGRLLPPGTLCTVIGPCADFTCKCGGKVRVRQYYSYSPSARAS